ncbi:MAG: SIS domain-containing protein [Erysipelotrichaceae bacterium]|nr:SIS domain-containing protein [Erysipelotrichaceae bacterium]
MNREELIADMNNTLAIEAREIDRLREYADFAVLSEVVEKIAACRGKVVITGCGTSAAAAKKIVHSLTVIDIPAVFLVPSDAVHGSLGVLQKDDIVVFISKGGNTSELTAFAANARQKADTLITVSENEDSLLAQQSDIFVKVKIEREPDEFNMLATASTMAVIAVFDAICVALMKYRGFTRESFALNHPGGAVGERLQGGKK